MISRALALLLLIPACVDRDDGLVVVVSQTHRAQAASSGGRFVTDRGYTVALTRAYLVVRTVQLSPCETSSARRWLRELFTLEGRAHAHTTTVPDFLGEASVDDLMLPDGTSSPVGRMQVLDVDHCAVNLFLGPAPASALNLPAGVSMEGRTLYLEGSYESPAGGPAQPLVIEASEGLSRLVPMARLSLASDRPTGGLVVVHAGYDRWLDGLDLDAEDGATAAAAALRRALAGLEAEASSGTAADR